jgi:hypothetical protein
MKRRDILRLHQRLEDIAVFAFEIGMDKASFLEAAEFAFDEAPEVIEAENAAAEEPSSFGESEAERIARIFREVHKRPPKNDFELWHWARTPKGKAALVQTE